MLLKPFLFQWFCLPAVSFTTPTPYRVRAYNKTPTCRVVRRDITHTVVWQGNSTPNASYIFQTRCFQFCWTSSIYNSYCIYWICEWIVNPKPGKSYKKNKKTGTSLEWKHELCIVQRHVIFPNIQNHFGPPTDLCLKSSGKIVSNPDNLHDIILHLSQ